MPDTVYDPNRWQHKEDNPRIDRLEREITHQAAKVMNDVEQRHVHPSYAKTKGAIRAEYQQLVGMITAWLYVSGTWIHSGAVNLNPDILLTIEKKFSIDLKMVQFVVEAA